VSCPYRIIKRNLWCRVFHRWNDAPRGGQARRVCWACAGWEPIEGEWPAKVMPL
jgi:hypothetical protein